MFLTLIGATALCSSNASAQQWTAYDSAASGSWFTSSIWQPQGIPGGGSWDEAYINDGHSVTLNFTPANNNVVIDFIGIYEEGLLAVSGTGTLETQIENYGTLNITNGSLTDGGVSILNYGTTTISNSNISFGSDVDFGHGLSSSIVNFGQVSLENSTVTIGAFSNADWNGDIPVMTLNHSRITTTQSDGGHGRMTLGGIINLYDGSTFEDITDSQYTNRACIQLGSEEYQINISGEGNKIIAKNGIIIDVSQGQAAHLKIDGVGSDATKNVLQLDGSIKFESGEYYDNVTDEWVYTYGPGTLALSNLTASLSSQVYQGLVDGGTTTLEFGAGTDSQNVIIAGNGSSAVDFVFHAGSGIAPGNSIGEFYGKSFTFDGATIYVEVGSATYDKIVSEGSIDFLGSSNVILTNWDNAGESIDINLNEIFESKTGDVKVGTENLADTDVVKVADKNEIDVQGSGTNKIIIQSAIRDGKDQFLFDDVEKDTSGTIVVKVTGQGTGSNPNNPNRNSRVSNLSVLNNVIWDKMTPGPLQAAIASYAGADLDKRDAATLQLDPAILSAAAAQSLDTVKKFVAAGNRRSLDRLGVSGSSQSCDPCAAVLGQTNSSRELWFQALGGWQNQTTTDVEGYTADTYGFALGVDKKINANTLLGVSFGGEFSSAKSKTYNSNSKADTLLFEVYGSHRIDALFISASGGYAGGDLESKRYAPLIGGFAKGKRDADNYFGNIELAYRFGNKWSYLTPFISYNYIRYEEDAFRETGNIALNVAEKNIEAHFQTLGIRLGEQFKNGLNWLIKPEVSLGWLHDYGTGELHTTSSFVAGGPVFTLHGVSRNNNRGVIGVNLNAELTKRTNVFVRYDGEFAAHYDGQYLSGGVNFAF